MIKQVPFDDDIYRSFTDTETFNQLWEIIRNMKKKYLNRKLDFKLFAADGLKIILEDKKR